MIWAEEIKLLDERLLDLFKTNPIHRARECVNALIKTQKEYEFYHARSSGFSQFTAKVISEIVPNLIAMDIATIFPLETPRQYIRGFEIFSNYTNSLELEGIEDPFESERVSKLLINDITYMLDKRCFNALFNNASVTFNVPKPELQMQLRNAIQMVNGNYVVMSYDTYLKYYSCFDIKDLNCNVFHIVSSMENNNKILIGNKAGYYFCPYILLANENYGFDKYKFSVRCGDKVVDNNYYAAITVSKE